MNDKKKYTEAKLELVIISCEDIVTTSVSEDNLYDHNGWA